MATARLEPEQFAEATRSRRAVYVFELPVRIVHWTIVATLVLLSFTGYYIYRPFLVGSGLAGSPGFTMGEMRFLHLVAGFVFIAAVVFRIYWSFVGNRYVHWRALFPITREQRHDLRETVRFYAFLRSRPEAVNGHNPLAALAYVTLYVGFIITALTGLGLFAWVLHTPVWTSLFGWTWSVLSVPGLRLVHFLLMFFYLAFAVHHVYAAVLYDLEERNGEMSSIFTGWKDEMLEDESEHGVMPRGKP